MSEIRVLAVRQPWASLIVEGLKTIEIRNVDTRSGKVAIYASNCYYPHNDVKRMFAHFDSMYDAGIISDYMRNRASSYTCREAVRGCIIGTVEIMHTQRPLAKQNGLMIEEIVQGLLPDLQYVGEKIDAIYRGRPLEIKSCQRTCHRSDRGSGERAGRFWFRGDQDKVLKDDGGYYALVVHDQGNCHFFCLVEAKKLLKDFEGAMTVSWRTIVRRVA